MDGINRIHLYWAICVLAAIIIGLLTWRLGANDSVLSYINFAATISSLLLAVVAIIYSVISNNQTSANLGSIKDAADRVSTVSNSLSTATGDLKVVAEGIHRVVADVPPALTALSSEVKQQNQLKQASAYEPLPEVSATDKEIETLTRKDFLEKQLKGGSILGLFALFLAALSHKTGKVVFYEFLNTNELEEDYITGYLLALSSSDLLEIETNNDGTGLQCKSISLSDKEIRSALRRKIDVTFPKKAYGKKLTSQIDLVEEYFSDKEPSPKKSKDQEEE